MCSHGDRQFELLPVRQEDEYHVFMAEMLKSLTEKASQLRWKLNIIEEYGVIPKEVIFDGKPGTSS